MSQTESSSGIPSVLAKVVSKGVNPSKRELPSGQSSFGGMAGGGMATQLVKVQPDTADQSGKPGGLAFSRAPGSAGIGGGPGAAGVPLRSGKEDAIGFSAAPI